MTANGNDPTGKLTILTQTDLIKAAQVLAQLDIDKIGDLTDYIAIPYVAGAITNTILAHLNTLYEHAHGEAFVYPSLADNVQLTSAATAWASTGNKIEVIPVNTLAKAFDIHFINISNISANSQFQIDIFSGLAGAEVKIGSTRGARTAVQSFNGEKRIQIPQQPANTRISARLSDSTAGTITASISFEGHFYG